MEVSEEKANQRVEEFKREMKTLTVRLKEAENRAESAEKQVKRLQKEVDRLEGKSIILIFYHFQMPNIHCVKCQTHFFNPPKKISIASDIA